MAPPGLAGLWCQKQYDPGEGFVIRASGREAANPLLTMADLDRYASHVHGVMDTRVIKIDDRCARTLNKQCISVRRLRTSCEV